MASLRGFQRATVVRIVAETDDARTFVLKPHDGPFPYQAGQFCIFRVPFNESHLMRSYSMSSAPEHDDELTTTIKRVPGGRVSNWMLDNLTEGDEVELTRAAGTFCLRPADGPLLGFSGGSGITPILSLAKSTLATTDRTVRLLCADRNRSSAIFARALPELAERYPGRLEIVRHFDDERGLLTPDAIRDFVGPDGAADSYVCGPDPFMDLVAAAVPGPGRVFSERFGGAPAPAATPAPPAALTEEIVTIILGNKRVSVPRKHNETLLESARRGGLAPPFNCQAGNCATCMARLTKGTVTMRVNDVLTDEEIAEGWILTCQSVPDGPATVRYE